MSFYFQLANLFCYITDLKRKGSGALIMLSTKQPTTENLDRYIAWKLSNKGKALKRLIQLFDEVVW